MKQGTIAALIAALIFTTSPASAAVKYANCAALNKKYAHGIAKNATAARTASGLNGKPFINAAAYEANRSKDRDKDGVACEK